MAPSAETPADTRGKNCYSLPKPASPEYVPTGYVNDVKDAELVQRKDELDYQNSAEGRNEAYVAPHYTVYLPAPAGPERTAEVVNMDLQAAFRPFPRPHARCDGRTLIRQIAAAKATSQPPRPSPLGPQQIGHPAGAVALPAAQNVSLLPTAPLQPSTAQPAKSLGDGDLVDLTAPSTPHLKRKADTSTQTNAPQKKYKPTPAMSPSPSPQHSTGRMTPQKMTTPQQKGRFALAPQGFGMPPTTPSPSQKQHIPSFGTQLFQGMTTPSMTPPSPSTLARQAHMRRTSSQSSSSTMGSWSQQTAQQNNLMRMGGFLPQRGQKSIPGSSPQSAIDVEHVSSSATPEKMDQDLADLFPDDMPELQHNNNTSATTPMIKPAVSMRSGQRTTTRPQNTPLMQVPVVPSTEKISPGPAHHHLGAQVPDSRLQSEASPNYRSWRASMLEPASDSTEPYSWPQNLQQIWFGMTDQQNDVQLQTASTGPTLHQAPPAWRSPSRNLQHNERTQGRFAPTHPGTPTQVLNAEALSKLQGQNRPQVGVSRQPEPQPAEPFNNLHAGVFTSQGQQAQLQTSQAPATSRSNSPSHQQPSPASRQMPPNAQADLQRARMFARMKVQEEQATKKHAWSKEEISERERHIVLQCMKMRCQQVSRQLPQQAPQQPQLQQQGGMPQDQQRSMPQQQQQSMQHQHQQQSMQQQQQQSMQQQQQQQSMQRQQQQQQQRSMQQAGRKLSQLNNQQQQELASISIEQPATISDAEWVPYRTKLQARLRDVLIRRDFCSARSQQLSAQKHQLQQSNRPVPQPLHQQLQMSLDQFRAASKDFRVLKYMARGVGNRQAVAQVQEEDRAKQLQAQAQAQFQAEKQDHAQAIALAQAQTQFQAQQQAQAQFQAQQQVHAQAMAYAQAQQAQAHFETQQQVHAQAIAQQAQVQGQAQQQSHAQAQAQTHQQQQSMLFVQRMQQAQAGYQASESQRQQEAQMQPSMPTQNEQQQQALIQRIMQATRTPAASNAALQLQQQQAWPSQQ